MRGILAPDLPPLALDPKTLEVIEIRRSATGAALVLGRHECDPPYLEVDPLAPADRGMAVALLILPVNTDEADRHTKSLASGKRLTVSITVAERGESADQA